MAARQVCWSACFIDSPRHWRTIAHGEQYDDKATRLGTLGASIALPELKALAQSPGPSAAQRSGAVEKDVVFRKSALADRFAAVAPHGDGTP